MAIPASLVQRPAALGPTSTAALTAPRSSAPGQRTSVATRVAQRLRQRWTRLWTHPARAQVLPLAGLSAISSVATASSPALLEWPLLLVALSPRVLFLSLAAAEVHWFPFLVIGTLRLCLADPFHHRIGQLCGVAAVGRLPRLVRRWIERSAHVQRPLSLVAVLLRPNGMALAWAGSQRIPRWLALAVATVSTVVYLLALRAGAVAVLG